MGLIEGEGWVICHCRLPFPLPLPFQPPLPLYPIKLKSTPHPGLRSERGSAYGTGAWGRIARSGTTPTHPAAFVAGYVCIHRRPRQQSNVVYCLLLNLENGIVRMPACLKADVHPHGKQHNYNEGWLPPLMRGAFLAFSRLLILDTRREKPPLRCDS